MKLPALILLMLLMILRPPPAQMASGGGKNYYRRGHFRFGEAGLHGVGASAGIGMAKI